MATVPNDVLYFYTHWLGNLAVAIALALATNSDRALDLNLATMGSASYHASSAYVSNPWERKSDQHRTPRQVYDFYYTQRIQRVRD